MEGRPFFSFMRHLLGKNVYKIHQWSGLIAGIFIFVMGLSGAVLVFHEALEHRSRWQVDNRAPVRIDYAYQNLTRRYPHWEVRLQRFSSDPSQTLIFSLRRTGQLKAMKLNTDRVDSLVHAVHFVEFGNWLVKALFCFGGLCAPLLSITGFLLWQWKKKKQPKKTFLQL